MKITRLLSVGCAAAVLSVSAGCQKKNQSDDFGKPASRDKLVYETEGKTKYDCENYSFEISNDFTLDKSIGGDTVVVYNFSSKYVSLLSVEGHDTEHITAQASVLSDYEAVSNDPDCSDVRYEILENSDYNAAALHYTDSSLDELTGQRVSVYKLSGQTQIFEFTAHYAPENESNVLPVLDDIAASAVRISDYSLPAVTQILDNDYFSVTFEPKWYCTQELSSMIYNTIAGARFIYAEAENPDKYLYPKYSISVVIPTSQKTAADYADEMYEKSVSDIMTDFDRGQEEILGFNAEFVGYNMIVENSDPYYTRNYYFDHNGVIYRITITVHTNSESDEQDISELIGGTVIKTMTEDEIRAKEEQRQSVINVDYTFKNAKFSLNYHFDRLDDDSDSSWHNYAEFAYNSIYIDMFRQTGYYGSQEDFVAEEAEDISRYDSFGTTASQLQASTFSTDKYSFDVHTYLPYPDVSPDDRTVVYYLVEADCAWRFEANCDVNDLDRTMHYMEEMLGTLTISESEN